MKITHQLNIEKVPPRQLAHAMLGLRYWLPRGTDGFSTDAEQALSVNQQATDELSRASVVASQNDPYIRDVADVARKERPALHSVPLAEKIIIASGMELTGFGTMVYDEAVRHAWFFPLPWRQKQSWFHWRDQAEAELLDKACTLVGLDESLMLLHEYQAQKFKFLDLPKKEVSPFDVTLPGSIKEIITFSGLTWQILTGESQPGDSTIIDWHGREVRVRCLPHPYCCLIEPSRKKELWQGLIKLKYET